MSTREGASCWMQLVSKLPCVPSREPARTWCLTCSGLLFGVGTFTAIMLAIWRALFPPLPPIVPGSPGGQGPTKVTTQNGVLNIKTDIGLALGGVAVVLIFMIVFYVVGLWVNRRPQRLLRAAALEARNRHIDQELGNLATRVSALAPMVQPTLAPMVQPTQMVRYQPARVPHQQQVFLNNQIDYMQENGLIREVEMRDASVLPESTWQRKPTAPGTQVAVPRGGVVQEVAGPRGGVVQEHTSNVYCEEGPAFSSTGLAV